MKLIRYSCHGQIPSAQKGYIHRDWLKRCIKELGERGIPGLPIVRVRKLTLEIYHNWSDCQHREGKVKGKHDNGSNLYMISDLFAKAGVIEKNTWATMRTTEVRSMGAQGRFKIGWVATFMVDETHPENKDTTFKMMPIFENIEMKTRGWVRPTRKRV